MFEKNSRGRRGHRESTPREPWIRGRFPRFLLPLLFLTTTGQGCPKAEEFQPLIAKLLSLFTFILPLVPAVPSPSGGCYRPYVNLFTGSLFVDVPILSVPAVPTGFDLDVYYNASLSGEVTAAGRGWRFSYDVDLLPGVPDPSSITVRWGDGRRDVFVDDGSGWAGDASLQGRRIVAIPGGYRLTTKHGTRYEFDNAGRFTAFVDRNSNAMTLGYDGLGRLVTIADPAGRSVSLTYDGAGNLVTIGGPLTASPTQLTYTGDRLVEVKDPGGFATQMSYDGLDRLVTMTDPNGAVLTVSYWGAFPVVREARTDGARRSFLYDQATRTTTVRDSLGPGEETETAYTMDAEGLCVSVTGPLGTAFTSYDGATNVPVSHTDEVGRTTSWTVSPLGDVENATDPTGAFTQYGYDPSHHLVTSITGPMGHVWTIVRDAAGNPVIFQDPVGNQVTYTYTPQGLIATRQDQRGFVTTFTRDAYGNITQVLDPAGFTTTLTRNVRGAVTSVTNRRGFTTTLTLDLRDQVTSILEPSGDSYGVTYTASGMPATVTDPLGNPESFAYDALDRLIQRTDRVGATTLWARNGAGVVERITDALGAAVQYTLDGAGRWISRTDADGGLWTYFWDGADLRTLTDPLGRTTNYDYSPRHELTQMLASGPIVTSFLYDAGGRLTSATRTGPVDPAIGFTYAYDGAGRLQSETATHLGNRTTTYVYDAASNVVGFADDRRPAGAVACSYDNRNRLSTISTASPPSSATLTYGPAEQIAQIAYSSGVVAAYIHDMNGRLVRIDNTGPGFLASYVLEYDPRSFRKKLAASTPAAGILDQLVTFDAAGRPLDESYVPGTPVQYVYDLVGNRTQKTDGGPPDAYTYSPGHRLLSAGLRTQTWDAAGNVTRTTAPGETTDYVYRADGTLQAILRNGQAWQITPDPFGRIARVGLPGGAEQWHVHDGGLRYAVLPTPAGLPTDEYLLAPDVESRGLASVPILWHASPFAAADRRALLVDPQGIAQITDGAGTLLSDRFYDLFGNLRFQLGGPQADQGFLGADRIPGLGADGLQAPALSSPDAPACLVSETLKEPLPDGPLDQPYKPPGFEPPPIPEPEAPEPPPEPEPKFSDPEPQPPPDQKDPAYQEYLEKH